MTTYSGGIRYFPIPSGLVQFQQKGSLNACNILYSNNTIRFELPSANGLNNNVKIALYDLKGGLEAIVFNSFLSAGHHDIALENSGKISQGFHMCALHFGSATKTLKIFIGK